MSAETLRKAASKMRQRAEATDADGLGGATYWFPPGMFTAAGWDSDDAEHIASWPPAVALAVADLLDLEATIREQNRKKWNIALRNFVPENPAILAVARAYLSA